MPQTAGFASSPKASSRSRPSIVKVSDAFEPLAKWKLGVVPVDFIQEIDALSRCPRPAMETSLSSIGKIAGFAVANAMANKVIATS